MPLKTEYDSSIRVQTPVFRRFQEYTLEHSPEIARWKREKGRVFNVRFPISHSDVLLYMIERCENGRD